MKRISKIFKRPEIVYLKNKIRPQKSYAQINEDLVFEILLGKIKTFIDIGANDGITGSNTFKFALNGAYGYCFEPVSSIFKNLKRLYRFNKRVICYKYGISDDSKNYEIRIDGVISTILETEDPVNSKCLEKYRNKNAETEIIRVAPLMKFINENNVFRNIDLLSIDVEGHELNVIKGINFKEIFIKCIVLESLGGKTTNFDTIHKILIDNDFIHVLTNNLNSIYIRKEFYNKEKLVSIKNMFVEYI